MLDQLGPPWLHWGMSGEGKPESSQCYHGADQKGSQTPLFPNFSHCSPFPLSFSLTGNQPCLTTQEWNCPTNMLHTNKGIHIFPSPLASYFRRLVLAFPPVPLSSNICPFFSLPSSLSLFQWRLLPSFSPLPLAHPPLCTCSSNYSSYTFP